jgi:hypothetical protein
MNYFLVIFIDFFIFLNLNSNLNFGGVYTARYRYRTPAVTAVTAVYRAVPSGKKNPGLVRPSPCRLSPGRLAPIRNQLLLALAHHCLPALPCQQRPAQSAHSCRARRP